MIRRETQTPTYWRDYQVTDSDLEHITALFINYERPRTVEELALAVIEHRCTLEDELIQRELSKGVVYQPHRSYEVGQTLVFPVQGYISGKLVSIRAGNNPEYGEFGVARLRFEGQPSEREYAIELKIPHRLSDEGQTLGGNGLLSPEDLCELHGDTVREALRIHMEQSEEFIRLAGQWFLKALLLEVDVGQLNLAEAALDVAEGGPLPTSAFLRDLDLPGDIDESLRIFSLNYALNRDGRFDEVGPAGQILWFLKAREPASVLQPARQLQPAVVPYERTRLDSSLVVLERELQDEWSDISYLPPGAIDQLTLILTYPHRRVGSLPLSPQAKTLFPSGRTERIRFLFRDRMTGDMWPGWVVQKYRYVFGLDQWYEMHRLPAGAYIELYKSPDPGVVEIDFHRHRARKEWVRVAECREGRLTFRMQQQPISCDYDALMLVVVDNPVEVDRLCTNAEEKRYPVTRVLYDIFPELAKLNPQGTVHAKTLYAAANVVRRLPPAPIFAVLMQDMAMLPVGDNYWLLTQSGPR